MKSVFWLLLLTLGSGVRSVEVVGGSKEGERRLGLQANNMNTGYYMNQLLQTHQVSNEAQLQSQRQEELRIFENDFKNMEYKIDEYRDGMAKKLLELKNSLQRPKVPIIGMGNMMSHPYASVVGTSNLAKAKQLSETSQAAAGTLASLKNDFQKSLESVTKAADSLHSMADPNLAAKKGASLVPGGSAVVRRLSDLTVRGSAGLKKVGKLF